jgi:hypothetical protein
MIKCIKIQVMTKFAIYSKQRLTKQIEATKSWNYHDRKSCCKKTVKQSPVKDNKNYCDRSNDDQKILKEKSLYQACNW